MNYAIGIPKGLCVGLEERGIDTKGMNGDQIHEILGSHKDFSISDHDCVPLPDTKDVSASICTFFQ